MCRERPASRLGNQLMASLRSAAKFRLELKEEDDGHLGEKHPCSGWTRPRRIALVPAKALGVAVHPSKLDQLIELGMAVKRAVNAQLPVRHPTADHITTVELTEICDRPEPARLLAKSAVIFGHGQLDRCPCGTGTSAAMAALHARGELPLHAEFTNESIIGTRFTGKLVKEVHVGDFVAVEPIVTGRAYITGIQQFVADPKDPFRHGFRVDSA